MCQYEAFLPLGSWNTVFPAGNLLKLISFPILVRNATGRNLNFTWTISSQPIPVTEGCVRGKAGEQSQLWGLGQGPAEQALSEGLWAGREQPEEGGEQWSVSKQGYVSSWREKPVISREKRTEHCAILFILIRMKAGNEGLSRECFDRKNHKCYLLRVPCKGYVFGNNSEFISLIIFYKKVNSQMSMEIQWCAHKPT